MRISSPFGGSPSSGLASVASFALIYQLTALPDDYVCGCVGVCILYIFENAIDYLYHHNVFSKVKNAWMRKWKGIKKTKEKWGKINKRRKTKKCIEIVQSIEAATTTQRRWRRLQWNICEKKEKWINKNWIGWSQEKEFNMNECKWYCTGI